jgi:hypothetical protein
MYDTVLHYNGVSGKGPDELSSRLDCAQESGLAHLELCGIHTYCHQTKTYPLTLAVIVSIVNVLSVPALDLCPKVTISPLERL